VTRDDSVKLYHFDRASDPSLLPWYESFLYQCSVHNRRYDGGRKVTHPRHGVDQIYMYIYQITVIHNTIYNSIRRQVSVIASYHQATSFKNHSIKHLTVISEEIPLFTKHVFEIH
jgi:hypothetical protein